MRLLPPSQQSASIKHMGVHASDDLFFISNDFFNVAWISKQFILLQAYSVGIFARYIMVIMMAKAFTMNIVFNKVLKIIMFREAFTGITSGLLLPGGSLVFLMRMTHVSCVSYGTLDDQQKTGTSDDAQSWCHPTMTTSTYVLEELRIGIRVQRKPNFPCLISTVT